MLNNLIIEKKELIKEKIKVENKLNSIKKKINEKDIMINKLCQHEWIIDYIDKPFGEGSNMIKYCCYCELTK